MTNRRKVIAGLAGMDLTGMAFRFWPEGGFINPCLAESIPESLLQRAFYFNASCTPDDGQSDVHYVERLVWLLDQMPSGKNSELGRGIVRITRHCLILDHCVDD